MTTTQPDTPDPGAEPDTPPHGQPALDTSDDAVTGPVRTVTTTVRTPRQDVGRHDAGPGAGERGRLSIEDGVVEKVAVAAAMEIDHVGGATRRVLGVSTGHEDGDGRPRVSVRVSGQVATLEVRLTVTYPASVRATTDTVRDHLRDRVHALTELTVNRVDITVAALTTPGSTGSTRRVA